MKNTLDAPAPYHLFFPATNPEDHQKVDFLNLDLNRSIPIIITTVEQDALATVKIPEHTWSRVVRRWRKVIRRCYNRWICQLRIGKNRRF